MSIQIILDKCTGCTLCVKACPLDQITIVNNVAMIGSSCTLCSICVEACPFQAIIIEKEELEMNISECRGVLLFCEQDESVVSPIVYELLGKGKELADKLGEDWAAKNNYKVERFPADWNQFGKAAGYFRNLEMARFSDVLVAFWDGESKGTMHMINIMNEMNKPVRVIKF